MRRIILALALCVTFIFEGFAQSDEGSSMPLYAQYTWPEAVQQKDCDLVTDPTSVCNTGGEALSEFLVRLCADSDFCKSRIYGPDYDCVKEENSEEPWLVSVMREISGHGRMDFTPIYHKTQCEKHLKTWYAVTAEHARFLDSDSYDCDPDSPENYAEDGGGATIWFFERKEGKWYVTDIFQVG